MDKVILLDCDGVLSNFVGSVCETLGGKYHPNDFEHVDLTEVVWPNEYQFLKREIERAGWCSDIEMYPGADEFVRECKKLGEVFTVTAPWKTSQFWVIERMEWLSWLGIDADHVIFTKRKDMVLGDFLIEDDPEHSSANKWRSILIDRPWNRGKGQAYARCQTYGEILDYLR